MENLIEDEILEKRKELAGSLEKTLSLIEHGGKSHDPAFITKKQTEFKKEYGLVLEILERNSEIDSVVVAHDLFQELPADGDSERIRKEARNALIYMHSHDLHDYISSC